MSEYYMDLHDSSFKIKKENIALALEHINKDRAISVDSLDDFASGFNWIFYYDKNDITGINFEGEMLGEDKEMFEALVPFIEIGSFVELHGDDGCIWRWYFDGRTVTEKYCELDFDDSCAILRKILEQKKILPTLLGIDERLDKRISEALK